MRTDWRIILLVASVATIIISVVGLFLGFPFFTLFLFFPLAGFGFLNGPSRDGMDDAMRCPECGSPLDPGDSFCRVCGRRL